jgi:hypothetical protein
MTNHHAIAPRLQEVAPRIVELLSTGEVVEESGRATGIIADALDADPGYVAAALLSLEAEGQIVRRMQGKRTYAIRLTTDDDDREAIALAVALRREQELAVRAANKAATVGDGQREAATSNSSPAVVEPPPPPPPEPRRFIDHEALAAALLRQAIDAAMTPTRAVADLAETKLRLGEQTEECQRLRRQLREAQDLVAALKADTEGLRHRAQLAEANLQRAIVAPLDVDRARELRDLERTMRTKPGAYAGNGERTNNDHPHR